MQDMGTVVSGKLQSGSVSKGDTVILMPNKTKVIVDTIFSDDQERASAQSGDNVKVRQFLDVITAFGSDSRFLRFNLEFIDVSFRSACAELKRM